MGLYLQDIYILGFGPYLSAVLGMAPSSSGACELYGPATNIEIVYFLNRLNHIYREEKLSTVF